jgi:N6-L-threonylcarbamoyladenine synthase
MHLDVNLGTRGVNDEKHPIRFLGIETSCDETALAVVQKSADGTHQILAEKIYSQTDEHLIFGGVVPEIAARAHIEKIDDLCSLVLTELKAQYGLTLYDLDGIAATSGPGLIGGVMVGLSYAKGLSLATGLRLYGINHLEGHALSAQLSQIVPMPYLLLLVSGGHCQLLWVAGLGDYERLGTTIDDAAGEALDKVAKVLGLDYPGGPMIEKEALLGDENRFPLPIALKGHKGCDFSFSGLKTKAASLALEEVKTKQDRSDLCASLQKAVFDQLIIRTKAAIALLLHERGLEFETVVVAGGVAANKTLRAKLESLCESEGLNLMTPPVAHCTDNAAMIALCGIAHYQSGYLPSMSDGLKLGARPRWPLDALKACSEPIHKRSGSKGAKA